MYTVTMSIFDSTDINELRKAVCFVSENIEEVRIKEGCLEVDVSEDADIISLKADLEHMIKKYKKDKVVNESFYKSENDAMEFYNIRDAHSPLIDFGGGQLGFERKGLFLIEYFDALFRQIAMDCNAIEKAYPVLLPVDDYSLTGYVRKSPQNAIFCSELKENLREIERADAFIRSGNVKACIKEPEFALSPSACFHTYIELKNHTLDKETLFTFRQNVFRNEGRLNYGEIGRLRDYSVREIVMVGSQEYVSYMRTYFMQKTAEIMKYLKLRGDISLSSDSFVIPKMQMYRKIQKISKGKYEMHMKVSQSETISTASFNLHGKAFTDPFNFGVKDFHETVTGCVGYGLQRMAIAFLAQYGSDEEKWPSEVRNALDNF